MWFKYTINLWVGGGIPVAGSRFSEVQNSHSTPTMKPKSEIWFIVAPLKGDKRYIIDYQTLIKYFSTPKPLNPQRLNKKCRPDGA